MFVELSSRPTRLTCQLVLIFQQKLDEMPLGNVKHGIDLFVSFAVRWRIFALAETFGNFTQIVITLKIVTKLGEV